MKTLHPLYLQDVRCTKEEKEAENDKLQWLAIGTANRVQVKHR